MRSFFFLSLFVFLSSQIIASTPSVSLSFPNTTGATISLSPNASFEPSTAPSGNDALAFSRTPSPAATLTPSQSVKGDEISFSMWIRMDDHSENGTLAFGLNVLTKTLDCLAPLYFNVKAQKTKFPDYHLWSNIDGLATDGNWHHFAFTYSVSQRHATIWFDGAVQRDLAINSPSPSPLENFLKLPLGINVNGAIADVRIWNEIVPEETLLSSIISPAYVASVATPFETAAQNPASPPLFSAYASAVAKQIRSFASSSPSSVYAIQTFRNLRDQLPAISSHFASLHASSPKTLSNIPGLPLVLDPYSAIRRNPSLAPADAIATNQIALSAARGEYESASFAFLPFGALTNFHISASALTGPNGATIPASAIDLYSIINWYINMTGWDHNWLVDAARVYGVLAPELLAHDDDILRVNRQKKQNLLRLSYPSGTNYVNMLDARDAEFVEPFNADIEPVIDADSFRPLNLPEAEFKQFWLTLHVPSNAVPGHYSGTLSFSVNGSPAGSLPLSLNVRPFLLPRPSPRYNPNLPYYGAWMNHITLDGVSLSNSLKRVRATLRSMHAHNMDYPVVSLPFSLERDAKKATLIKILAEEGCATHPLVARDAPISGSWPNLDESDRGKIRIPSEDPHPEEYTESMLSMTNTFSKLSTLCKKLFGHSDIFLYGWDEAPISFVRQELPFFAAARHYGFRPFVTLGNPSVAFGLSSSVVGSYSSAENLAYHEAGCLKWTYGAPFSGPESPAIWRRLKGLTIYMANGDGIQEYVLAEGWHIWNEFTSPSRSPWRNFMMIYPTLDGALSTLAWEGIREGFDDVRYLTLLRRLTRYAMSSPSPSTKNLAIKAIAWSESLNPETANLDAVRNTASSFIIRLTDALSPEYPNLNDLIYDAPYPPINIPDLTQLLREKGGYLDVKLENLLAEAKSAESTPEKAESLFAAAETAQALRQKNFAAQILNSVCALPDLPRDLEQRARIRSAANLLLRDQYGWKPQLSQINEARAILDRELSGRRNVSGAAEMVNVRSAIIDAERSIGMNEQALKDAKDLINFIGNESKFFTTRSIMATQIGQDLLSRGNPKEALKFFELALDGTSNRKSALRLVGAAAAAIGDYSRALEAYADALKIVGKRAWGNEAEFDDLTRLVKQMNANVREAAPTIESEPSFDIDLDE